MLQSNATRRKLFMTCLGISLCGSIALYFDLQRFWRTSFQYAKYDVQHSTITESSAMSIPTINVFSLVVTIITSAMKRTFLSKAKQSKSISTNSAADITITGDAMISPVYFVDYVLPRNYTIQTGQNLSVKNILFHNKPFWLEDIVFSECEINACAITTNRNLRSKVEAVLYHVDFLSNSSPPPRPMGQVWVAFALESPVYYHPPFRSRAWRSVFNWTMTYRLDSDIFCPYHGLVFNPSIPDKNYTNIALRKSKSVAWFVSKCETPSMREEYVNAMQKQNITIDIYGDCGSYNCSRNNKTCENILNSTYRFYLSFENSICRDYVTEKFFKTFGIDVVPVVRGGTDYKKYFPRGTFIDTADFKSASELVKYLKYLETNLTAYAEILEKKDHYRLKDRNPWCKLCEMLHFVQSEKTYSDLPAWVGYQTCRNPTDIEV